MKPLKHPEVPKCILKSLMSLCKNRQVTNLREPFRTKKHSNNTFLAAITLRYDMHGSGPRSDFGHLGHYKN